MNGEFLELYSKIDARFNKMEARQDAREEKQDHRHEDNLKTFGKLPCKTHAVQLNTLWTVFISGFVLTIIIVFIRKAIAG